MYIILMYTHIYKFVDLRSKRRFFLQIEKLNSLREFDVTNKPHVTNDAEGLEVNLARHVLQSKVHRAERWCASRAPAFTVARLHAYENSPGNQWRIRNARHEMIVRGSRAECLNSRYCVIEFPLFLISLPLPPLPPSRKKLRSLTLILYRC